MPLIYINIFNLLIWFLYAVIKLDLYMSTSQGLGFIFNLIQAAFYHWAIGNITSQDTPKLWVVMRHMIAFFKHFAVKQGLFDIKEMFWQDESTQIAQFYMKTYK